MGTQEELNVPGDIHAVALTNIPKHFTKTSFDEIPTTTELARAIAGLLDGNAPGGDGIPAKYGCTVETICSADCIN